MSSKTETEVGTETGDWTTFSRKLRKQYISVDGGSKVNINTTTIDSDDGIDLRKKIIQSKKGNYYVLFCDKTGEHKCSSRMIHLGDIAELQKYRDFNTYKKTQCVNWEDCHYGSKCMFAHTEEEWDYANGKSMNKKIVSGSHPQSQPTQKEEELADVGEMSITKTEEEKEVEPTSTKPTSTEVEEKKHFVPIQVNIGECGEDEDGSIIVEYPTPTPMPPQSMSIASTPTVEIDIVSQQNEYIEYLKCHIQTIEANELLLHTKIENLKCKNRRMREFITKMVEDGIEHV